MKKHLLFISLFSLASLPCVHATPSFSQPILGKANEQINLRIEQKISQMALTENPKKSIEQKKERLSEILISIDTAFQSHDTVKLREQVKLFRDGYKETMDFIQNAASVNTVSNTHKNIRHVATDTEAIGKNTDITYYADSFEGGKTANGNPFSQAYFSAAACDIPFNTLIQIRKGTASVIVKTNDRPNCAKHPDLTDLTTTAFRTIGKISSDKVQGTVDILGTVPKNYTKRTIQTTEFEGL
jgi:rare lipoprotein A (peptidoglycan hydrolase)